MEQNVADVPRRWTEALNRSDLEAADMTFTADCPIHISASAEVLVGPTAFKEYVRVFLQAFPDLQFNVEDQVVMGDKVAQRWRATGTHMRSLPGIAPTRKKVTVHGMTVDRVADGRIVERWELWDEASMLRQIGAMPSPGTQSLADSEIV